MKQSCKLTLAECSGRRREPNTGGRGRSDPPSSGGGSSTSGGGRDSSGNGNSGGGSGSGGGTRTRGAAPRAAGAAKALLVAKAARSRSTGEKLLIAGIVVVGFLVVAAAMQSAKEDEKYFPLIPEPPNRWWLVLAGLFLMVPGGSYWSDSLERNHVDLPILFLGILMVVGGVALALGVYILMLKEQGQYDARVTERREAISRFRAKRADTEAKKNAKPADVVEVGPVKADGSQALTPLVRIPVGEYDDFVDTVPLGTASTIGKIIKRGDELF